MQSSKQSVVNKLIELFGSKALSHILSDAYGNMLYRKGESYYLRLPNGHTQKIGELNVRLKTLIIGGVKEGKTFHTYYYLLAKTKAFDTLTVKTTQGFYAVSIVLALQCGDIEHRPGILARIGIPWDIFKKISM